MSDSQRYPWNLNVVNNFEDNVISEIIKYLILIISTMILKQEMHFL